MKEVVDSLVKEALSAAEKIKLTSEKIRILSHYDCDGISSAAIMVKTLMREKKSFHLSIIKQLTEDEIEMLSKSDERFFIFLDFGAGQLDLIQEKLKDATIIIADHHQPQGEIRTDSSIIHINPTHFGITENISGSGVTYLIARGVNPENIDLSELAIIGAIGDSQAGSIGADWGVSGINREILKDAESVNKIKVKKGLRLWGMNTRPLHKVLEYSSDPAIPNISGSESGAVQFLNELNIDLKNGDGDWRTLAELTLEEQQKLASGIIRERIRGGEDNPDWIFGDVYELPGRETMFSNASEFATMVNACGKLNQSYLGIALCFNDVKLSQNVKTMLKKYRKEIGTALSWVQKNPDAMKRGEVANYIFAEDNISEHIISNVTSILSKSNFSDKPLFAFAHTEDSKVKVSARASDEDVRKGVNLKEVVAIASKEVGGEGGGHIGSAGATIPKDTVERFINSTNSILKNVVNTHGTAKS
ncbi:MAG: DHH family phosphoesterase [Candidatus Aenigmatarchaeota archaeon]